MTKPSICFASGSNRVADIRGFSAIGRAIGVAFPELTHEAEMELTGLANTGVPVFVDSGAFSEIEFGPAGPVVVKPITEAGWTRILALYRRLATALGSSVYVVAPDRIGDQEHTLALLTRWADDLREIAALGANVLVPIQKGTRTQAEFHRAVEAVLGFDFTPAIPSKKNATTVAELTAYVEAIHPRRIHLLGMGETGQKAAQALAAIAKHAPGCVVTMDSNLIMANVGRTNGRAGGRSPLTHARDVAQALIEARVPGTAGRSVQELGIIIAFGEKHHLARVLAADGEEEAAA